MGQEFLSDDKILYFRKVILSTVLLAFSCKGGFDETIMFTSAAVSKQFYIAIISVNSMPATLFLEKRQRTCLGMKTNTDALSYYTSLHQKANDTIAKDASEGLICYNN